MEILEGLCTVLPTCTYMSHKQNWDSQERQVSMALRRVLLILFSQFILIREASNCILACLILSHLLHPCLFSLL